METLFLYLSVIVEKATNEISIPRLIFIINILTIGILSVLASIVVLRTIKIGYTQKKCSNFVENDYEDIEVDDKMVGQFQESLRFETIPGNLGEFTKMINFIINTFKTIHNSKYVTMETEADHSLLYSISGSDKSLTPYLLLAHLDVVPADPNFWILPPFSGKIKDGFIYSRGATDFKNGVMGILEALENLLSNGFKPSRSFYVSISHSTGDRRSTERSAASSLLQKRGLTKLEFILDKGCIVTGDTQGIAMIGVTEKTDLHLNLTVKGLSGHSALRLGPSPYGVLATAIAKIENHPHPSLLGQGPEKEMLENLAPIMKTWDKLLWSNIWIFRPVISKIMSRNAFMNAVTRTVHTITDIHTDQIEVGEKVVPERVTANIRVHVHPSQTVNDVITHFHKVINDPRVEISTIYRSRMASISPSGQKDFGYQTIYRSIQQVFDPYLITPGIYFTRTESSKYHMFTNNIYRFTPSVTLPGDEKRLHGKNERLSIQNYGQTINFYKNVIINADKNSV